VFSSPGVYNDSTHTHTHTEETIKKTLLLLLFLPNGTVAKSEGEREQKRINKKEAKCSTPESPTFHQWDNLSSSSGSLSQEEGFEAPAFPISFPDEWARYNTPQPSRNSLLEGVLVDRNAGLEMLLIDRIRRVVRCLLVTESFCWSSLFRIM
jgi:hypothetical protein